MIDYHECFLCLDGVDLSKGKLFHPCKCSHIHEKCLQEIRKRIGRYTYQCPTCRYEYKMVRVWFANIITNPITITIFTFFTIVISVVTVAWFINFFAYLLMGVKIANKAFALSGKIVWWAVLFIGFTTMLLSLLGDDIITIPNLYSRGVYIDPYFFEFIVYGFSIMGFLLFIKSVYNLVHIYTSLLLSVFGQRILEVSV